MFKELFENFPKENELEKIYKKIPSHYKSITDRRDFIVSELLSKHSYKMSMKLVDLATDYVKENDE